MTVKELEQRVEALEKRVTKLERRDKNEKGVPLQKTQADNLAVKYTPEDNISLEIARRAGLLAELPPEAKARAARWRALPRVPTGLPHKCAKSHLKYVLKVRSKVRRQFHLLHPPPNSQEAGRRLT